MKEFYRYPHTPHLAWLGPGRPRDDKVLSENEAASLLTANIAIEEKLDGANLGISLDEDGNLRLQNRGSYLTPPFSGQFSKAGAWLDRNKFALSNGLGTDLILFGEWCAARHSVYYNHLPDCFLGFDIYDRCEARFWSVIRRDALVKRLGLAAVPKLATGPITLPRLKALVLSGKSHFAAGPFEGVVLRRVEEGLL